MGQRGSERGRADAPRAKLQPFNEGRTVAKNPKGTAKSTKGAKDEDAEPTSKQPQFDDEIDEALGQLDSALDAALNAPSRGEALAALTQATSGMNGLLSPGGFGTPMHLTADDTYLSKQRLSIVGPTAVRAFAIWPFNKSKSEETQQKVNDRIQKYWATVEKLVQKYGPTQYQISIGFPQVVTITLSWDVNKPPSPSRTSRAVKKT